MQTQTLNSDSEVETKSAKTPVIYLADSVKKEVLETLKEGLSHLNVEFADDLKKANMIVMLEDDLNLIRQAWENGIVPITTAFDKSITDYNPNTESGNAFVFKNKNQWEVFAAIVRACETYKFPYDWRFIVRSCKASI